MRVWVGRTIFHHDQLNHLGSFFETNNGIEGRFNMIKEKRHSWVFMALFMVMVWLMTTGLVTAADQPIRWKGGSCFGLASPLGKYTIVLWKENVEKMSGGRMVIELHDAGEIVPPTKIYDAVKDGILDFGMNTPAWQKGKYPAGDLYYTLIGGITEFNDLVLWMYAGGGKELEQEMYKDELIVLPIGLTPPKRFGPKSLLRPWRISRG